MSFFMRELIEHLFFIFLSFANYSSDDLKMYVALYTENKQALYSFFLYFSFFFAKVQVKSKTYITYNFTFYKYINIEFNLCIMFRFFIRLFFYVSADTI